MLISILFWLSIVFGYLTIVSFAQAFDINAHEVAVAFIPLLVIPLGVLLNKFRKESITQNNTGEKQGNRD
jgi:hypothetical protein